MKGQHLTGPEPVPADLVSRLRLWPRIVESSLKKLGSTIRGSPWVLLLPFCALVALLLAGHLGVHAAAKAHRSQRRELADGVASSASQQVSLQLQAIVSPNVALGSAVRAQPYVPQLAHDFGQIAGELLEKLDPARQVRRIQMAPWAIVTGVYPAVPAANLATLAFNFLKDPQRFAVTRDQIAMGPNYIDVLGPVPLLDNSLGFVSRMTLFIPNTTLNNTFGMDKPISVPYAPGVVLGNATDPSTMACGDTCGLIKRPDGSTWRFWGVLNCVVGAQPMLHILQELTRHSITYKYMLYRRSDALASALQRGEYNAEFFKLARSSVIFQSNTSSNASHPAIVPDEDPACHDINIPAVSITWGLCVVPEDGWDPSWLVPMQIMISFISVIVAALLFAWLLSSARLHGILKLMLPTKVIPVLARGRTYAEPFKDVTVLFADIVGYTNMSSEMKPEELVDLLNRIYTQFDLLVDKHHVYKVETIGDAFMVVGGAPEPCDSWDAAARMARLALDMVAFIANFECPQGRRLQIRVGMYTGDITAAVVGQKMPHWTLVGDTVNTASRMQSTGKPMHIHVGDTTAKALEEYMRGQDSSSSKHQDPEGGISNMEFELQSRGWIEIKGKGRMATFFLWASGANIPDRSSAQRMSRGPAPNAALNAVDNADAKSQENLQEILSTEAVVCFESDKLERVLLADAQTDSMALPSPPVIPQQRKP